jgi:FAD/FMN-containing dehydrogenase
MLSSMDVVVQPSVPWMSLNDQIKESGLFFPVDPGPSVSIPHVGPRPPSGLPEMVSRTFVDRRVRPELEVWWGPAAGKFIKLGGLVTT